MLWNCPSSKFPVLHVFTGRSARHAQPVAGVKVGARRQEPGPYYKKSINYVDSLLGVFRHGQRGPQHPWLRLKRQRLFLTVQSLGFFCYLVKSTAGRRAFMSQPLPSSLPSGHTALTPFQVCGIDTVHCPMSPTHRFWVRVLEVLNSLTLCKHLS